MDEKHILELRQFFGERLKENEPISKYVTFHIGGPARFIFEAKTSDEIVQAVKTARHFKIPYYILAGGSNVLFSDEGFDGLIILLAANEISVTNKGVLTAESGAILMDVVSASVQAGFTGFEWAAGIPGQLGGAVRGNAGAYGGEIKDICTFVEVLRGSKVFSLTNEQCGFAYRHSIFKENNDIILSATFKLEAGNPDKSLDQINDILAQREEKIPEGPSAGCVFKNIPITSENKSVFETIGVPEIFFERGKVPTGYLIDQLGLRGTREGGAMISERHGNIIVNSKEARATDVLLLLSMMENKVQEAFGIDLVREIQYVEK